MSQFTEKASNFAQVMELVEILSLQEQETLIEITKKWVDIKRREEIAMSITEAHEEYKTGKAKPMSIDELMAEITA